jgi:hypothetical protein
MWLAYVVCSLVYLTTTLQLPSNYWTTDLTPYLLYLTYQMKTMYIVIFVMLFAMLSAMLYLNIVF